jgi:hypothetical protein
MSSKSLDIDKDVCAFRRIDADGLDPIRRIGRNPDHERARRISRRILPEAIQVQQIDDPLRAVGPDRDTANLARRRASLIRAAVAEAPIAAKLSGPRLLAFAGLPTTRALTISFAERELPLGLEDVAALRQNAEADMPTRNATSASFHRDSTWQCRRKAQNQSDQQHLEWTFTGAAALSRSEVANCPI